MPEPTNSSGTEEESKSGKTGESGEGAPTVPAGVVPVFFTGAGQQIFQCVADKDVTPESPLKLIPKEKILEDFSNRAAVSDFHPIKKKVQVRVFLYNAHHKIMYVAERAYIAVHKTTAFRTCP